MGQCIYVALVERPGARRGEVAIREIPSELWMHPDGAGRALAVGHHMNTTVGVWFYERDLWDKRALKRRLLRLVDEVTAPGFLDHYKPLRLDGVFGRAKRRSTPGPTQAR